MRSLILILFLAACHQEESKVCHVRVLSADPDRGGLTVAVERCRDAELK